MRKSIFAIVMAAGASALFGSPAAAAPIGDVRTIAQLGTCMYISHKETALQLLDASTAAQSDQALLRLKDEQTCFDRLPQESTISMDVAAYSKGLMRGMLAEAALRSSPAASALQPLPFRQMSYARPWFIATGRDPAVDEMAACVADSDPAGVLALIATAPATAPESWAIGDLNPWLGKCLARGAELHADRIALRAALADALYQRVRDPQLSLAPAPNTETRK